MGKLISLLALSIIISVGWRMCSSEPPRVTLTWDVAERYTSTMYDVNDPDDYREMYIIYKIVNREDERSVTKLRWVCENGRSTQFEQRDIPPHARMEGKLKIMIVDVGFDPDSCEPRYEMATGAKGRY